MIPRCIQYLIYIIELISCNQVKISILYPEINGKLIVKET
jgi:hypothetical protein